MDSKEIDIPIALAHFMTDQDDGPYVVSLSTTDPARAALFHELMRVEGRLAVLAKLAQYEGIASTVKYVEGLAPNIDGMR